MLMDSQVKFCQRGNISGASQQNRAASVRLNSWGRRRLVSKRRTTGKDDQHGFIQLVHSPAASGGCCSTVLQWSSGTMKLHLTFNLHRLSRSWLKFCIFGWTVPSMWFLKQLEREPAVSPQPRLTWTPEALCSNYNTSPKASGKI